jgi:hypothetical protein
VTEQRPIGSREVWGVVKASALHRLGKPILVWYAALFAFGLIVVAASVVAMRCG